MRFKRRPKINGEWTIHLALFPREFENEKSDRIILWLGHFERSKMRKVEGSLYKWRFTERIWENGVAYTRELEYSAHE